MVTCKTAAATPTFQDVNERVHTILAVADNAGLARKFARVALVAWDLRFLADDVTQAVTELFSNACLHACKGLHDPHVQLMLRHEGDRFFVGVWDPSPTIPRRAPYNPYDLKQSGRGLVIVRAVSERYGFYRENGGKVAWARFKI